METWVAAAGFPGYEVSDAGHVRRLSTGCTYRLSPAGDGYVVVHLGGRTIGVHVLVLLSFVGPRPPGHDGAHKNDDPADNRLENLAWVPIGINRQRRRGPFRSWVRLDPDLCEPATASAQSVGMGTVAWVNRIIRERLGMS